MGASSNLEYFLSFPFHRGSLVPIEIDMHDHQTMETPVENEQNGINKLTSRTGKFFQQMWTQLKTCIQEWTQKFSSEGPLCNFFYFFILRGGGVECFFPCVYY